MNINRINDKVEARNTRTVALNDLNHLMKRKDISRKHMTSGADTIAEYKAIVWACDNGISRAKLELRMASRALATLR